LKTAKLTPPRLPSRTRTVTRPLTPDDLRLFDALRAPLSTWLQETHGRAGQRAGLQGLCSAAVALVAMHGFGVSPLLALLHALITLAAEGLGARIAVNRLRAQEAADAPPFLSPGHALAFARAVIDAQRGSGASGAEGLLPASVLPNTKTLSALFPKAVRAKTGPEARWVFFVRWLLVVPVMVAAAVFIAAVALSMVWPLARATVSLFDTYDWAGLVALLAINAVQLGSLRRELTDVDRSAPWAIGWLVEPPRLGDMVLWRQYKLLPLMLALIVALVMVLPPSALVQHYQDPAALAHAIDAQLLGIATGLFILLALLNTLSIAAPAHARRLCAELSSIKASLRASRAGRPP
jgi:hypothetical protein